MLKIELLDLSPWLIQIFHPASLALVPFWTCFSLNQSFLDIVNRSSRGDLIGAWWHDMNISWKSFTIRTTFPETLLLNLVSLYITVSISSHTSGLEMVSGKKPYDFSCSHVSSSFWGIVLWQKPFLVPKCITWHFIILNFIPYLLFWSSRPPIPFNPPLCWWCLPTSSLPRI